MNTELNTVVPHYIKLRGRWWTGNSWSGISTFAKAYSPQEATRIIAKRWRRGARVVISDKKQWPANFAYVMPYIVPRAGDDKGTET